jgi:phosphatidylethanolamine-binding protein (PEBP) family uncharacterized protein
MDAHQFQPTPLKIRLTTMEPSPRAQTPTFVHTVMVAVLIAGLLLVGCGGDGSGLHGSSGYTSQSTTNVNGASEHLPAVSIGVRIPGLLPGYRLPRRNTCDGADVSPPVRWKNLPRGTVELALFVISFKPVHGRLFFDWAVTGLNPALRGLSAGTLPAGAVVGSNSLGRIGYSICPEKGKRVFYAVKVLALPRPLTVKRGFGAAAVYNEAERSAQFEGFGGVNYTRP